MSHVRVERFAARDDQEHGAKHREPGKSVDEEEADRVPRIEGAQHGRRTHDPDDAQNAIVTNQTTMIGTEQPPDAVRAVLLNQKEPDQNHDRHRHDIGLKQGRRHFQPFDRTEHRDGRRDHAVAIEQRGSEDAERNQQRPPDGQPCRTAGRTGSGRYERGQREHAPLALVVGAHHDHDVLDRDDEQERVDDEREHAEHVVVRRRNGVRAEEALAHGVQRTRPDVAVDDAERGEGQGKEAARSARHRGLWQPPHYAEEGMSAARGNTYL